MESTGQLTLEKKMMSRCSLTFFCSNPQNDVAELPSVQTNITNYRVGGLACQLKSCHHIVRSGLMVVMHINMIFL